MSEKPVMHGRDHRPGGMDPIPDLDTISYPQMTQLPLGVERWLTGSPGDWGTTIDATRKNNWKLEYKGAGTGTLEWPVLLGPAGYDMWMVGAIGTGYGTMQLSIAGAYDDPTTGPGVSDWVVVSKNSFSNGSNVDYPYLRLITNIATSTVSGIGIWTVRPPDGTFGTLSTSIDSFGNLVGGGPGYFWIRVEMTNYTEMSELWLINGT